MNVEWVWTFQVYVKGIRRVALAAATARTSYTWSFVNLKSVPKTRTSSTNFNNRYTRCSTTKDTHNSPRKHDSYSKPWCKYFGHLHQIHWVRSLVHKLRHCIHHWRSTEILDILRGLVYEIRFTSFWRGRDSTSSRSALQAKISARLTTPSVLAATFVRKAKSKVHCLPFACNHVMTSSLEKRHSCWSSSN